MSDIKHPFADAIAGEPGEAPPPLQLVTAVVLAVDTTTDPSNYGLTLQYGDGTVQSGINYLGWWSVELNAVVNVLVQGPTRFVLGPNAPAAVTLRANQNPPEPPAPPPVLPAIRSVPVAPVSMASWDTRFSRWRTDGMYQGGGWTQRAFWFYGTRIAAAKGAGTITAATIVVPRQGTSHGTAAEANVRLGTHTNATQPGTGGTAHSNVARIGGLRRGKTKILTLTAAQVAALNAGATGVGLEPGTIGYATADYLIGGVGGASGQLILTING